MNVRIQKLDFVNGPVQFSGSPVLPLHFEDRSIELKNVIVFPGLVNAHDHLEFNLFPTLGSKLYTDYKDWGGNIHETNKETIRCTLAIPLSLRIKWGILKNLLNGVTNIVHHGYHHDFIRTLDFPVYLNYQYLHSLETEPYWKVKLNFPLRKDIMIHVGEGISEEVKEEFDKLLRLNFLQRNLIGIHAIRINKKQAEKFKAIVWCPDSNIKLYGETADVKAIKAHTKILFGTDSAVSASSNVWEHLRLARRLNGLSEIELFESLTKIPASMFNFSRNSVVIAKKRSNDLWDSFFLLEPEDLLMVVVNGKAMLVDESVLDFPVDGLAPLRIGRSIKFVPQSLCAVIKELESQRVTIPLEVTPV